MRTTERILDCGLAKPRMTSTARFALVFEHLASIWRVIRNRRQISSLYDLDDNQLLDIGLTRHDLNSALLTSAFFEDPSSHLTTSARRRGRSSAFNSLPS